MNVFDLVQVYVSIQSSGKPMEHFLADEQFLSLHFKFFIIYVPYSLILGKNKLLFL